MRAPLLSTRVLRSLASCGLPILLSIAGEPSGRAQDLGDFPFDRFSLAAGSFYATTDADVRVDAGTASLGTLVSLEEDLGLDDSTDLLRLELEWRFLERHQLTASYFELSQDGGRSIARDVEFGGTVFPIGASVAAEANLDFIEVFYTWWAAKTPRGGFGLNFGVAAMAFDAQLRAALDLPGGGGSLTLEESASTDLPVPLIGIEGRYAFARRWLVAGVVRFLPEVSIEDWKGDALSYGARIEVRLARHFGLGAAWNGFAIDAEVEQRRLRGSIDFSIEGAQLFLRFAG